MPCGPTVRGAELTNGLRAGRYREDITTRPMLLRLGRDVAERDLGHQV